MQFGKRTKRVTGQHVAQFFLMGIYTGTRATPICSAVLDQPTIGRSWVDLRERDFLPAGDQEAQKEKQAADTVRLPPRLLRTFGDGSARVYGSARPSNGTARGQADQQGFQIGARAAGFGDDVMPHTLRHTCATWLAQRGVPTWEAAGFLGMTEQTFIDVYGHHHPDHQKNAVNAFGLPRQFPDRYNETKREQSEVKRCQTRQ